MTPARWLAIAALAGGFFSSPVRAEWPFISPRFQSGPVKLREVLIMPAQFDYKIIGFKGVKGGVAEGEQMGAEMYTAVATVLGQRGVSVLPNPLDTASSDAERYAVADLQTRYDIAGLPLRKSPGIVRKGKLTLDDRVASFQPAAGSDALVFIRGYGKGKQLVKSVGMAGLRVDVVFVNSKTGEVLGLVRFTPFFGIKETEKRLEDSFREALHDLPLPTPPSKH